MRFSLVVCQRVSRKHHASGHEDGADKKPGSAVQFLRRMQNVSTKLRKRERGGMRTSTPAPTPCMPRGLGMDIAI
jgi:hypothetical protein